MEANWRQDYYDRIKKRKKRFIYTSPVFTVITWGVKPTPPAPPVYNKTMIESWLSSTSKIVKYFTYSLKFTQCVQLPFPGTRRSASVSFGWRLGGWRVTPATRISPMWSRRLGRRQSERNVAVRRILSRPAALLLRRINGKPTTTCPQRLWSIKGVDSRKRIRRLRLRLSLWLRRWWRRWSQRAELEPVSGMGRGGGRRDHGGVGGERRGPH